MSLEFDDRLKVSDKAERKAAASSRRFASSSARTASASKARSSASSRRSASGSSAGSRSSSGSRSSAASGSRRSASGRTGSAPQRSSASERTSASGAASGKRRSAYPDRSRKPTKAEKQLAKLEEKNAKLEAKNKKKQDKRAARAAKKEARQQARSGGGGSSGKPRGVQRERGSVNAGRSRGQEAPRPETVGEIRKRERDKRNAARYRRYVLRIVLVCLLAAGLVFGAIFVYRSDLFAIEQVQANGVTHLTSAEITELAAVPDDSTLLRVDTESIVERLEANAWVQAATVTREFPDTICIDIEEREAGAVVRISKKSYWVISKDGVWLSAATDEDVESLMLVTDVSSSLAAPVSGSYCDDGGIENALAVLEGISDEFKAQVESISAESSIKTALNLSDGIIVAFGDSSDIALKESVVTELLETYEGKITYINVRTPSRPTYRTL